MHQESHQFGGFPPYKHVEWHGQRHFRADDPKKREICRVTELKDDFGHTRYKVAVVDSDGDLDGFQQRYRVNVTGYGPDGETYDLRDEEFDVYEDAVRHYETAIREYEYIVKTQTKDFQNIQVYAERINYRRICPNCCATCRYGMPTAQESLFDDWRRIYKGKRVCTNSKLFHIPRPYDHEFHCENRPMPPPFPHRHRDMSPPPEIRPVVDADGICDGYEPRKAD